MERWTHVGFVKYARRNRGIIVILDFKNNPIEIPFANWDLKSFDAVLLVLDEKAKIIKLSRAADLSLSYTDLQNISTKPNPPYFTGQEIDLLRLSNKMFDESYLDKTLLKFEQLLNGLSAYVDSSDIARITATYSVYVSTSLHNKAGEDDSVYVSFSNSGPELSNDYFDIYLKTLLPDVNKNIYSETAFAPARRMLDEFMQDKERWAKLEEEAKEMTRNFRSNAIRAYSRDEHYRTLSNYLEGRIKQELEIDEMDVRRSLFFYWLDSDHKLKNQLCAFFGGTYQEFYNEPI